MVNLSCLAAILALALVTVTTTAFVVMIPNASPPCRHHHYSMTTTTTTLAQKSSSRLAGNSREPTPEELQLMDEMIDKLANAKPYELPNAVRRAFRVISSPPFFLRIATRVDQASTSAADRDKLSALATNLVSTIEAVVSTTTEQLEERATQVQNVVQAAAEPENGEFLVPLVPSRVQAMRDALRDLDEACLDEGFLSTVDAWMNKSHQDGMDLMVGILQKVLQLYAGTQIGRAQQRGSDDIDHGHHTALLEQLLDADADQWDRILLQQQDATTTTTTTLPNLLTVVQRTSETVVLSLEAGSMAQRVQAEYLQELMKRIEVAIAQNEQQQN